MTIKDLITEISKMVDDDPEAGNYEVLIAEDGSNYYPKAFQEYFIAKGMYYETNGKFIDNNDTFNAICISD